jgi:hypothetical protein
VTYHKISNVVILLPHYIKKILRDNGKYRPISKILFVGWGEGGIFFFILKRERKGLRTKRLLTITFSHKRARGRGCFKCIKF